jgi:hypothetical protein
MLPTICAFVLSFSAFNSDSIEERAVSFQGTVCQLFAEEEPAVVEHIDVAVVEVAVEENQQVTVTEEVEVVANTEPAVDEPSEVEVTEVDLAPEAMPETEVVTTTATAPESEIFEDDITDVAEEAVVVEEVVADLDTEDVVEADSLVTEEMAGADLEDLLAAWPHLSEDARKSILLLVRIDMDVE